MLKTASFFNLLHLFEGGGLSLSTSLEQGFSISILRVYIIGTLRWVEEGGGVGGLYAQIYSPLPPSPLPL